MLFGDGRAHCDDCGGTGKCQKCYGTGKNPALNSDEDKCPKCGGTGACPTCRYRGNEFITLELSG
jgi:hypothetical protein